jgi:hypothetical protein
MKRVLVLVSLAALVAMVGCTKPVQLDNKDLVGFIFQATMSAYSATMSDTSQTKTDYTKHLSTDYTMVGPAGGNCHVLGDLTLTVNVDEHGNYLGGSASFQQTQTWSDYAFEDSTGHKWTLNGAPDISTVGLFTLQPNGTFGTASSIDISGAVRATGPGGSDHTADFLVTVNIDPDGRGGDVSGTVDGQSLHYTF